MSMTPPYERCTCHFMDTKEAGKEAAIELTRESLIALSYSVPDMDQSPGPLPKNPSSDHLFEGSNKAENIRSELISISYTESPDMKAQPVSPGEHKA